MNEDTHKSTGNISEIPIFSDKHFFCLNLQIANYSFNFIKKTAGIMRIHIKIYQLSFAAENE